MLRTLFLPLSLLAVPATPFITGFPLLDLVPVAVLFRALKYIKKITLQKILIACSGKAGGSHKNHTRLAYK